MESPSADYDYTFDPEEKNNTAAAIYALVLDGGPTVLDVGSGPAIVSSYLAREHNRKVVALDASAALLEKAREHGVEETHIVDLDHPQRFAPVAGRKFDVIILADVLEHLIDPGAVLNAIRDNELLSDDGFLVVSIPNAAHESVIAELLGNRFEYRPTGLLDETHIRWFTHRSFEELAQRAGYLLTRTHRTRRSLEQTDQFGRVADIDPAMRRQLAEINPEIQTFQYVMRVEPSVAGPQIAQLSFENDRVLEKLLILEHELRSESDALATASAAQQSLEAEVERLTAAAVDIKTAAAEREVGIRSEGQSAISAALTEVEHARANTDQAKDHARAEIEQMRADHRTVADDVEALRRTIAERDEQIDAERTLFEAREEQVAEAESEAKATISELANQVAELKRSVQTERHTALERLATVDKRTSEAVAKALDAERQKSRTHITSLQEQLDAVYASNAWRVGSTAKSLAGNPIKGLKELRRPAPRPQAPKASVERQPRQSHLAMPLTLRNNARLRASYEQSVARRTFETERTKIVFAVWTTDLAEGRGDLYVAAGLGRQLEKIGYEVAFLPRQSWHAVPDNADAVVAMLPMFEPLLVPAGCRRIAWIRNETQAWGERNNLSLYDGVLASSRRSLEELSGFVDAPTDVLKIGVDTDLFVPPAFAGTGRNGVVTTVNQWGRPRDTYTGLSESDIDFDLAILGQTREFDPKLLPYAAGMKNYFELPSAYQHASLVIDDLNHTTKAYGNINSRLFEALAAGALVVTNSAQGLDELGLSGLPVYDEPAELNPLIRDLLSRPAECEALAERLSGVVRRDHGFEARARKFHAFWESLTDRSVSEVLVGWHPEASHRVATAERAELADRGVRTVGVSDLASVKAANSALGSGHEFILVIDVDDQMLRLDGDPIAQLRGRQAIAQELDRLRGGNIPVVVRLEESTDVTTLSATQAVIRRDLLTRADLVVHAEKSVPNAAYGPELRDAILGLVADAQMTVD